ncbi:MAG: TolC family protein [Nitrospiraceae bacterium]|nr:TolC family protein [Nitrospiraceae bacterium]
MRKLPAVMPIILALLLLSLAPCLAANQNAPAHPGRSRPEKSGLEELIREALGNNPGLKAAEERLDAYSQIPSQAESWDNPRLGVGLLNLPDNSFSFEQEPMTQKQVTVAQEIPFPGKLPLKGQIAGKDVDIAAEAVAEKKNGLIMQVKTVYWDLLLVEKTIAVTRENRDLLRDFVKTAESRYAVGKGIQQDVLKAQVELSKMIDMLIRQQQRKQDLTARLNTLLYRPIDTKVTEIEGQDLDRLPLPTFAFGAGELEKMAAENRPVLAGARRRIEKYRLAVRLAKKDYYPDFDVAVSYGQREGRPDFVSGSVMVAIPLWHKTKEDRKVAQERANVIMAREQYDSLENDIFFSLQDAVLEMREYADQIDLFKTGLLPQARAALQSAIAGYGVNKVDFVTLIDNQLTLYDYEIKYYGLLTDYENTMARIEAAVGKRLF